VFGQSGDFLIWSSSRSAAASNSHALPYIVVKLELLASDQSGAFFSRAIVKLNLELCSCACPIAHHAPSPPPLPTTVLLQQLQALYDVLFLILAVAVQIRPVGVRTQHTDIRRGTSWMTQLLYGHPQRLYNLTRMRPEVFRKLLEWLQINGGLKDTKLLSAAEKLLIFLLIFSNNQSYRLVCEETQHAISTVKE